MCVYTYTYIYIHTYVFIYRERERERCYVCMYIHIYIYICIRVRTYIYIYIYIHIYLLASVPSSRSSRAFPSSRTTSATRNTVSFHNFKSQNFKSRVSNPKNKYVAYLSVLSRISNCQGLGRNNNLKF